MKTARLATLLTALAALATMLPQDASAIPVFARKYGVNCTMCHSSFPRLNDFGARFRANGYRLPGRENIERTVLESPAPLALRTSAGYNYALLRNPPTPGGDNKLSAVELNGLDILSAGLLGAKIGYFMVFVPGITESRGVAGQEASLEMASLVFSGIAKGALTVRAGRFEPAYTAFSVKRQLSASPYEIYDYSFPGGPAYSETQTGVEMRGGGYGPLRAVAGLVAGSATNQANDSPQDVYLRVEGVLGPGEGQTAGHRFGLVGYAGRARPGNVDSTGTGLQSFTRIGADASLNLAVCNLALQYLWSRDKGSLWGENDNVTWSGGFAEVTCTSSGHVTGFARYDMVKQPSFLTDEKDIRRITAGARYHFEDNVAAHLEYSRRVTSTPAADDPTEESLTARLDMAL